MKVAVIGPGALGCLFAARMARSGTKVTLIDHRKERAERLEQQGITVESAGEVLTAHPSVSLHVPTGMDFILVLTKAYATEALRFPPEVPVLTLQNGLGNVETLCSLVGSARVLAGTTSEACTQLDVGLVRHTAAGLTRFGGWTSCDPTVAGQCLRAAGFEVALTDSPGQIIWEKTAVCAAINPLTALMDVPNGKLLELVEVRQLMRDLVVEAAKVAAAEGYRFDHSLVEVAEQTCADTSENISSMLQDIRASRPTEIDAISGEILHRAQLASLPTPRTRVIHQLVKGLENR